MWACQVALVVKNPTANAGDKRRGIFARRIPWTEEPGGSHTLIHPHTHPYARGTHTTAYHNLQSSFIVLNLCLKQHFHSMKIKSRLGLSLQSWMESFQLLLFFFLLLVLTERMHAFPICFLSTGHFPSRFVLKSEVQVSERGDVQGTVNSSVNQWGGAGSSPPTLGHHTPANSGASALTRPRQRPSAPFADLWCHFSLESVKQ